MKAVTKQDLRESDRKNFWGFVTERQHIWHRRYIRQEKPPWTADPILATNRFTNVYRELDPGTQYAKSAILEADAPRQDRMFNIMIYRLIGRRETHDAIGLQHLDGFSPDGFAANLRRIQETGQPVFTSAYMVSAYHGMGSHDKITNVARLFGRLHKNFGQLFQAIGNSATPQEAHAHLSKPYGFGNFLSYQILVDLCYPLDREDGRAILPFSNDDWASAGPGAKRGIAILQTDDANASELDVMRWLRDNQADEFDCFDLAFPYLTDSTGRHVPISLANIQNCLCEFHKYEKIRHGTGRARRRYDASAATTSEPPLTQWGQAHV